MLTRVLVPALVAMMLVIGSTTVATAGDVEDCQGTTSAAACRRLAEQGESWAQHNLGWMYENGHGVSRDYEEAVTWYRKAADAGLANSQYNLGVMYANGHGVRQDYKEAATWYRKAADQNFADGQYNLGWAYLEGHGVPQDYVQAYMWLDLALAGFPPGQYHEDAAKSRDLAASKMSPAQIKEAQRLAQEWKPQSR